jgi:NAD(P)-dependent dehydrogenase (short-subunit alcohol dehydrogenase family)
VGSVSRPQQGTPKAALRNVTQTLASELIGRHFRVNAVSPGVIETPLFCRLGPPDSNAREFAQVLLQQIPAKRFGKPEEVATAVALLASDDASGHRRSTRSRWRRPK